MNVLGICAHPDDLEIGCGGTLIKYAKQGHKIFMCNVANGSMGHAEIMPDELSEIRANELKRSAEIIGAEVIGVNGVGDGCVEASNKNIQKKLVEIIRYTKADLIITHNPDDYMRDHVQVSNLAFDASFAATFPHLFTQSEYITNFPPVFYMDTLAGIGFVPTEYVDISEEIEAKLQALSCHESQYKWLLEHDNVDFIDFVRTSNKYRGQQCGVPYAEGFCQYKGWSRIRPYRLLP